MTNYCPYCHSEYYPTKVWPNDPINTPFTKYNRWRGFTFIRDDHITTIQEKRKLQEAEAGIPENERTVFTPVGYNIRKTHIKELRESTEKILTKIGITKNTYFNYYEDGNFANTNQLDWTDVNLNNYTGNIRAKHIEDLRHPLVIELGWLETWENSVIGVRMNVVGVSPTVPGWQDAPELISNPIVGVMADWEFYGQYRHNHLGTVSDPNGQCWVKGEMKGSDENYYMYVKTTPDTTLQYSLWAKSGVYIDGNLVESFELTENTKMSFDISDFELTDTFDPFYALEGGGIMIEIKTSTVTTKPITYYVHSKFSGGSSGLFDHHALHNGQRGITLSFAEFQSFDRNLWTDYITIWGEAPATTRWIDYIKCEAVSSAHYKDNNGSEAQSGFSIDNIKLYEDI